jgi:hypothetical protein
LGGAVGERLTFLLLSAHRKLERVRAISGESPLACLLHDLVHGSLFGMHVQDLVRTVDYALSRADAGPSSLRVIGKDMGALWALYAAALDPCIEAAVCHGGLISYRALTTGDRYVQGANIFLPDVLEHFDLPQVAAAAQGRRLALLAPVDAMRWHVDPAQARSVYAAGGGKVRVEDRDLADQYFEFAGRG